MPRPLSVPFFELVLPHRAAKAAVPVLAAVSVVGIVALALRRFDELETLVADDPRPLPRYRELALPVLRARQPDQLQFTDMIGHVKAVTIAGMMGTRFLRTLSYVGLARLERADGYGTVASQCAFLPASTTADRSLPSGDR